MTPSEIQNAKDILEGAALGVGIAVFVLTFIFYAFNLKSQIGPGKSNEQ